MKPAVGFTLPSAGVTPAPGIKRKVVRSALLCSRSHKIVSPVPLPAGERACSVSSPSQGEDEGEDPITAPCAIQDSDRFVSMNPNQASSRTGEDGYLVP